MALRVIQPGSGSTRPLVLVYLQPLGSESAFNLDPNVAIVADKEPSQNEYTDVAPLNETLATLSQQLGAIFSPVILAGFSAGGLAVRHLLNLGADPDVVVLADGTYGTDLAAWTAYAQKAIARQRVFVASYSSNIFMEPAHPSPWRNLRTITGFNLPLGDVPGRPADAPVTSKPIFTQSGNAIVYSYPDRDHESQGRHVLPTVLVPKAFDLLGTPETPPSTSYWWFALAGSIAGLAGYWWWQQLHEPKRLVTAAPAYAEESLPPGIRTERSYSHTPPLDVTEKQIRSVVNNKEVGLLLVRARDFLVLTLEDFDRDVAEARATGMYNGRAVATIEQYNAGLPEYGPPNIPPSLSVELGGKTGKITSHEGRHRALALYFQNEDALIWVAFKLKDARGEVIIPAGYANRYYSPGYIRDPGVLGDIPAKIRAQFNKRIVKLERFDALDPYEQAAPNPTLPDVGLGRAEEAGVVFETCVPVTFRYVHNTDPAPHGESTLYSQDVEPAGVYMIHVPGDSSPPSGWIAGTMHFDCPLVLELNLDPELVYGPLDWKQRLHKATRKKRLPLSKHLLKLGYDGIVTVRDGETSEIVDLRPARTWKRSK